MPEITDKDIEDLALLFLYLSSWDENVKRVYTKEPVLRAWKNIRFEILDRLTERGLVNDARGAKSVYLTEDGIKTAEELRGRFFDR